MELKAPENIMVTKNVGPKLILNGIERICSPSSNEVTRFNVNPQWNWKEKENTQSRKENQEIGLILNGIESSFASFDYNLLTVH